MSNEIEDIDTFDDMGLNDLLLRGIYSMGFETPSAIQRKAIKPLVDGRDVIAQAQSGTGKTATFLIGGIQRINQSIVSPQLVVVAPSRELAQQIFFNFEGLNTYMKLKGLLVIGGTRIDESVRSLNNGVHVVVGTPGRILDMISRQVLKTDTLQSLMVDEADEMLSKGFQDQLVEIFRSIPATTQVGLFSATMPEASLELTGRFMREPLKILVKKEELTLEGIKQFYLPVEDASWKLDTLFDLYDKLQVNQTIIFTNSRKSAEWLSEQLKRNQFTTSCIHGEMPQDQRDKIMKDFRVGRSRVLVTTDIIARGIDIQQVSVVINYELPRFTDTYIHRIGRSGRFGRKGTAINFVSKDEYQQLQRIIKYYNTQIEHLPDNIASILSS
jgi:superfamily II DNA/RNA helicase